MPSVVDRADSSRRPSDKPNVDEHIQRYLDPDERLLWQSSPRGGLVLRKKDIMLIPFSLVWTGFAIFWTIGASAAIFAPGEEGSGNPFGAFFLVPGLLFICIGLFMTFGRFFVEAYLMARTTYALTSRRALIRSGFMSRSIKGLPLGPDLPVSYQEGRNGWVKFGTVEGPFSNMRRGGTGVWFGDSHPFLFERIDDAERVYRMVREIQIRNETRRSG